MKQFKGATGNKVRGKTFSRGIMNEAGFMFNPKKSYEDSVDAYNNGLLTPQHNGRITGEKVMEAARMVVPEEYMYKVKYSLEREGKPHVEYAPYPPDKAIWRYIP